MEQVIFDAVVDVGNLADVKLPVGLLEVFLQLAPAIHHLLQSLPVVQVTCVYTHTRK